MTRIKQKYQDLFFQTEQTVNRKKSRFRAAPILGKCDKSGQSWTGKRDSKKVLSKSRPELKIFVGSFLLLRSSISRIIFQFSNGRGMIHKNFVKTLDHKY